MKLLVSIFPILDINNPIVDINKARINYINNSHY